MNYDQNLRNLRNQICSDWTRDDTKFIQIDSSLWRMCQKTLKEDAISKDKELGFVDLGPHLSTALSKSTYEDLGALAEGSVCSFFPIISVEQIASLMGHENDWELQRTDLRFQYYRLRFACSYWGAVRDMALRSRSECLSYFGIGVDIVNLLATATPNNIIDFCHGNPLIHNFKLRCPQEDCVKILSIMHDTSLNEDDRFIKVSLEKARKSNHCCTFNPNKTDD